MAKRLPLSEKSHVHEAPQKCGRYVFYHLFLFLPKKCDFFCLFLRAIFIIFALILSLLPTSILRSSDLGPHSRGSPPPSPLRPMPCFLYHGRTSFSPFLLLFPSPSDNVQHNVHWSLITFLKEENLSYSLVDSRRNVCMHAGLIIPIIIPSTCETGKTTVTGAAESNYYGRP